MKRGAKVILVAFIILISLIFYPVYQLIKFETLAESQLNTFDDGDFEKIINVPDISPSFNLELPVNAEIVEATINLTIEKHDSDFAFNPYLRISSEPSYLWQYQSKGYGAFGNQLGFDTGLLEDEVIYNGDQDIDKLKVFLPANAEVYNARVNLTGFENDYWSRDIQQLNLEPDGAGDYEPELVVFKDRLYVTYRTYYDKVANGSDADIVIISTNDGKTWSNIQNLTSNPDSLPPYNNTYTSADWRPTLEKFKNRLYCAWESNSTDTSGADHDILLRSTLDGTSWDSVSGISDQWEGTYSNNPGFKNDWTADMVDFNNDLWMVWVTNNTDNLGGFSSPIGDIIITQSSDGVTWSEPLDLTKGDDWFTSDLAPNLVVFNNSLYAVWVSNNSKFSENDHSDFDIVFRNTTDGKNWSTLKSINPPDNDFFSGKGSLDTSPKLTVFENKLLCVWISAASYTHGGDWDIYMRYTSNGSFLEPGTGMEITSRSNIENDHSPHIIGYEDRIYVTWVMETNENSDIMVRYLNISTFELGLEQQINQLDSGGFDYWPQLGVFNNTLFVTWDSNDTATGSGLDRDIIITSLEPSKFPLKVGIDIGVDGTWDIAENFKLMDSKTEIDLKSGFQDILSNPEWVDQNATKTQYGFRMCKIPMRIRFNNPGKVLFEDLKINYDCTLQVKDFSEALKAYMAKNLHKVTKNNTIIVPFKLSSDTKGKIKVSDIRITLDYKPTINIINIPTTGITVTEPIFRINWKDFDSDSNASISLYFDNDKQGYDGELIISNLSEDAKNNYYDWVWWHWKQLRSGGSYYIYANITDGRNYFVNYSSGQLNLEGIRITDFLNITVIEPDGINDVVWDRFEIQWDSYCPDFDAKISLYYDDDNIGYDGQRIDLNNDGEVNDMDYFNQSEFHGPDSIGKFNWNVSQIDVGSKVYIYAKITDKWNISYHNYSTGQISRAYVSSPRGFTLVDDLNPNDDDFTTHNKNPRFSWLPPEEFNNNNSVELEYVFNLWLGSDNSGEKVFEKKTNDPEVSVTQALNYGFTYFAEVYAKLPNGNRSMKSAILFSLVNHKPQAPEIRITPDKPTTTSILNCTIITKGIDHDGDGVEYLYYWFKDDIHQQDYDNKTDIKPIDTNKGELWRCLVFSYDQIEIGNSTSKEIKILNSPPTIDIESPTSDKEYKDNKVITFKFKVTDPDLGDIDKIQYIIFDDNKADIIKTGYIQSDIQSDTGFVEFPFKLSKGTHNLIFNVSDGSASSEIQLKVTVKGHEEDGFASLMLYAFYGIIFIVILLIMIFIFLFIRIKSLKISKSKEAEKKDKEELSEEEPEPDELLEEDIEDEELELDELDSEELEEELEDEVLEEELAEEELEDEELKGEE